MTVGRDRDVESLCLSALALRVEERAAFLDEACAGDARLRTEVEALLTRADGFLETPAWRPAPMSLTPGIRLGPYEVQSAIGAGGMGEVHKARDTRLDRTVAIKVLSPDAYVDPEHRARFEREARTVAHLNHPHICTLYDVGEHDGATFLVMEYLEGETLAARLEKGPLPLEQALTVAMEIADALAAAHRQGVVHRDLKPGNVMLTTSGAKLLDFGLAKTAALAGLPSDLPTRPHSLTGEGVIVGTLQYMAPEQIEGRPIDARTDIFAFGAVVHEMLTGQKAFRGESLTSLISSILTADPSPVSNLLPLAPPALDRALHRCLAKEPGDRWQCAGDLVSEIRWIAEGGSPAGASGRTVASHATGTRALWATAAMLSLALTASLAVIWTHWREAPVARQLVRFTVAPPAPYVMGLQVPALSPDGAKLVFTASRPGEPAELFVRDFAAAGATVVPETAGASSPFWSPDGRQVAFFSGRKLRKVALGGGLPVTLADGFCCGAWGRGGEILFTYADRDSPNSMIMRISSDGGAASPVLRPAPARGEVGLRWPVFLPDNRHFLYEVNSPRADVQGIYVTAVGSAESSVVMPAVANVAFVSPGLLVYRSGGRLLAQAFDWKQPRLIGNATQLSDTVGGAGAPVELRALLQRDAGRAGLHPRRSDA